MLFAVIEEAPEATPSAAAAPTSLAVNREEMLNRLGGDEALFNDVVAIFLEDCPQRLAAIKAAVEARDGEQIRQTAHALKGAAGNLAAAGLFEAAKVLERLGAERRLDAAQGAWRRLWTEAAAVLDQLRRFETAHRNEVRL
jgi:HPt (histidine-containing phosphotransfer) domain-containing protein